MKFLNHNLFTGDITVNGTTTLSTATGITRATGDNSTHLATTEFVKAQGYATTAALSGYVPITRTITINGTTLDLSADRTWTIATAGTVRTVYETVKNASGATILKGTPLSVMPGQTSGNVSDVQPADASDPTKMPAVFIANEDILNEAEGEAVLFGNLTGVNTAAYASGTTVYVAPGGGWTATKPVWPNKIQNLGVITKQHATNGAGIVTGVGRANDLPNLTAGKIWVGSANYPIESTTVHVDEANGRVGIGTTSPSFKLDVNGDIRTQTGYIRGANSSADLTMDGNIGSLLRYGTQKILLNSADAYFYTANAVRMFISNAGNVGIGTTSPGAKLDVNGAQIIQSAAGFGTDGDQAALFLSNTSNYGLSGNFGGYSRNLIKSDGASVLTVGRWNTSLITELSIESGSSGLIRLLAGASERMRITSAGNVGIGTTSPEYKLHVRQAGITAAAISTGWPSYTAESAAQSKIALYLDTDGNGGIGTAGYGASVVTQIGQYYDSRGVITMIGAGGASPSDQGTGYGKDLMVKAGNSDNNNGLVGGRLFLAGGSGFNSGFNTNYGSVVLQPQGGNVGIGITSPGYKLSVDSVSQSTIAKFYTSDNNYSTIEVGDTGDVYSSVYLASNSGNGQIYKYGSGWGAESGMLSLYSSNGPIALQAGGSTKVFVTALGSVGIGTASPTNKLQLANGDMSITSGYSFILADTDTNWRLGRNIISENGNQLTANTMQFVAANAANEGWQFVDDDGNTRFEIGASTGTVWLPSGNLYLNGNLAATQAWVTGQGYLTSYTETDTLATVTARGNTTTGSITVLGGMGGTETTDGYGLEIMGNYTNGQYNHRLSKFDKNGGVPLYIQFTSGTANVWSNSARFGSYSGNGYEFEVYGAAKVNGDFASTGQINASGGNSSQWNTAYGWGNHASAGYLTSYSETDTLATVTSRGATTSGSIYVNGDIFMSGTATTTNQARTIDFTGFDKEGTTDFSDRAYIQHTINTAGHAGSVLVISSQNDADDGIGFLTNASSQIKHNGHVMWDAGNDGAGSGLDADLWDGYHVGQASNWASRSTNDIVSGMMSWRNYGNSHVIFDASASLSPSGTAINNTTPQVLWTGTYPTLMGWNGTNTYGVRVDAARAAETASNAGYATNAGNADTVDSLHASDFVRAYTTTSDNIDSDWGQSFKTFDPVPSGTPPIASPNLRTINVGENFTRRTQLAFTYATDQAWFRRRDDGGWQTWREFIHSGNIGSQSVSYATTAGSVAFDNLTSKSSGTGTYQTSGDFRAPIFYDSNDTNYYLDPNSSGTSLRINGGIAQNNIVGRPYAVWGASGTTTGAVVIKFPGGTGNYGMVHAVVDIYEYNSNDVSTVIIGGHNWNGAWYSYGAQVIGTTNKQVRLAVKDGKYCIVIGDGSSSWSYGQVVLRKIQNGTYYDGVMDVSAGYTAAVESDSYSWVSGDLRNLETPSNFTAGGTVYASGGNSSNWNTAYGWGNHAGLYQPLENQRLSTGNSVTFTNVYNNAWFRNNNVNEGLYNQATGTHFYSNAAEGFAITGSGGVVQLQFRSNHQSTIRGYVYADTGNNIGFLNNGGSWSFRTTYDRNAYLYGSDLTIGEGGAGATNIIMKDGDEGDRVIHCNSNRIGFLTQSGSWGAYLDDSTNWFAVGSVQAPIFYDSDNTAYYLDPNSNSVLSTAQIAAGLTDNGNTRIYMPGGAWSVNSGSGTGGAIKISLPTAMYGVNTMMSMTVQVYEYSTGQSFTIRLGGYNYYNHDWYNVFAYMVNDSGKGGNVPVYFGNDGTRDVIWLGEPGWSWSYPNVFVTDFQAGHTQYAGWKTGWSVSFDTGSRTNVSASRTAYRQIDTGNYNSYSPTLTGGGASGTWGISISGNAATATSATSATTATTSSNVTVNSGNTSAAWYPIVWHSGNTLYSSSGAEIYAAGNYIRSQYINTSDNDETGITRFVIKNGDNYHRSATTTTAANIIRDVASGSWGISITGNAATASSASSATNLYGPGGSYIKSSSTGTSYTANYQIRENDGGGNNTNEIYAPQLAFHWSGVVASSIMLEASGRIAIRNNPGGSYEAFMAGIIYSSGYGDSTQWNTAYSWGNHASAGYATAASLSGYVSTTNNSSLNSDSRNTRGVTRLYRRDDNSDFSVQTHWTGTYWRLEGYNGDTYHAGVSVAHAGLADSATNANYANSAGSASSATSATEVVTIQDNPPTGANGKLWWESDTGKLKVYYGSSSAWVDASPIPDMSLYYQKAGGVITGDVTIQQTLTVVGNTLIQGILTETSDISLKENILPLESSLEKVMQLKGVSFNKIETPELKEIGFIAQEVESVIPELVTETEDGIKTVSYSRVTAVLVETVKEQQAQIDELKELVLKLSEKLNNL